MITSAFLPTGPLLESLINLSNEVTTMENIPPVQSKNISTMIRRIKLLSSLFEDIQDNSSRSPLPPSSILCLTELYSVIRKVKLLIQECRESSSMWQLIRTEFVSNQFHVLVKDMGRALDILPLSLLRLSPDTREQVELLHRQVKRLDLFVDPKEIERKEMVCSVIAKKNDRVFDFVRVKDVFVSIGLKTAVDFEGEISRLEGEARNQAGTGGLIVVSNIRNLVSLLTYSKSMVELDVDSRGFPKEETCSTSQQQRSSTSSRTLQDLSSCSSPQFPDEFRCPISLDLMIDPVIVASGHTYDRNSIARWINSGHHTCPKSGQRLIHMALIPNYALKSLVHQWCQDNNVSLLDDHSSSEQPETKTKTSSSSTAGAVDHISVTKSAAEAAKMTAEFLVGKLAMGSTEIQNQAAYELRLLAKTGMDNRRVIAEAGAIPFLTSLLRSSDARIQENAVTALLNLSIYDNNKVLITASGGAVDSIITVLETGKTMEARENAAAAIFSLSMIDGYKVSIGGRPRAIPALLGLLKEGTTAGKRDAASALFNLAVYNANKAGVVGGGAVPLLIEALMDDKAGITDDALAVLALLLGCGEGLEQMRKSRILVPLLVDLLRFGSAKGKENAITLLLGLCKDGGEEVARRLLMNPRSIPCLQSLSSDGSLKARRKADALLRLLNRCCSHSQHSVNMGN
ncbi:unnamed protein product [Linum tenue]|uniref:RING-type E3 ubiquitin transferase n=3 Tax=Linum tenue TaxID=586396 RepID=A0AAV0K0G7_9ROSI|nr:unnamed protein product [Linum tenue]